jgi:DNA polymerase-4
MALALAERKATDLVTVDPDPAAYRNCSLAVEKIASRYAPAFQSDTRGNWYLDITGTTGLFGTPVDCASRVLKEIALDTGLYPAAATAGNKLVGKVATRTIRPTGLIHIRQGDEAVFLAHQDIRLLPGLGPSLLRTLAATGFREIGELAVLGDGEALALFGRRGLMLRDTARGMDDSRVFHTADGEGPGPIERWLDFEEDVIDFEVIRGALAYLTENAGADYYIQSTLAIAKKAPSINNCSTFLILLSFASFNIFLSLLFTPKTIPIKDSLLIFINLLS